MLDFEYVVVLEGLKGKLASFEGRHPRLVRLLLREERLPRSILDDPDPGQPRFLQSSSCGGPPQEFLLAGCLRYQTLVILN